MSSGTSTEAVPPKGGSVQAEDSGFHVSHFFVLLSLMAATAAVVIARPSGPESLILISLTIGAAGAAGFGFYRMLAPLVAPRKERDRELLSNRLRADLEREKALTLRSIKELEFDRAMGKLSTQDFDEMSGRLRTRAVGIIKRLDAGSSAYRALIEKELAARIGGKLAKGTPDLPPSREATAARQSIGDGGKVGPTGVCACGTANDSDARFCKNCGAKLRAA